MTTAHSPLSSSADAVLPPLMAGDRLDQPTFHVRYLAMPEGTRAELIEGIVYMSPPVGDAHSRPHLKAGYWLAHYERFTPGVAATTDGTTTLGLRSQPQPDSALRVLIGGQARLNGAGFVAGCPELVVEVASSTEATDLHAKRREYDRHGALEYVVVVVRTPCVAWMELDDRGRLAEVAPGADGIFRSRAFPGLWLDALALLAGDLNRLATVVEQGVAAEAHAAFVAELAARAANPTG